MIRTVPSAPARSLVFSLKDQHGDPATERLIQEYCGLRSREIWAESWITTTQRSQLLQLCLSDRGLGVEKALEVVSESSLSSLGPIADLVKTSATICDAIVNLQAYSTSFIPDLIQTTQILNSGELMLTTASATEADGDEHGALLVARAAVTASVLGELTGTQNHGGVVSIPRAESKFSRRLHQRFPSVIKFRPDDTFVRVVVPVRWLDRPPVTSNHALHAIAMKNLTPLLDELSHKKPYSALVAMHLCAHIPMNASLTDVALRMATTDRTLRRRLVLEETSFQRIKHATMLKVALDLAKTAAAQGDVAKRVGKQKHHFGTWFFEATGKRYKDVVAELS